MTTPKNRFTHPPKKNTTLKLRSVVQNSLTTKHSIKTVEEIKFVN
jgi:hypothetical protein